MRKNWPVGTVASGAVRCWAPSTFVLHPVPASGLRTPSLPEATYQERNGLRRRPQEPAQEGPRACRADDLPGSAGWRVRGGRWIPFMGSRSDHARHRRCLHRRSVRRPLRPRGEDQASPPSIGGSRLRQPGRLQANLYQSVLTFPILGDTSPHFTIYTILAVVAFPVVANAFNMMDAFNGEISWFTLLTSLALLLGLMLRELYTTGYSLARVASALPLVASRGCIPDFQPVPFEGL